MNSGSNTVVAFKRPGESLKCSGTNSKGLPCGNEAIEGGSVCPYHGGSAPQVKAKAEARLDELVPHAVEALGDLMTQRESLPVAYQAAKHVLDRRLGPSAKTEKDPSAGKVQIIIGVGYGGPQQPAPAVNVIEHSAQDEG